MAPTNRERVGSALDQLRDGLLPYFRQLVVGVHNESAWQYAVEGADRTGSAGDNIDLTRLFNIFHEYRNDVFRDALGRTGLNFIHELQDVRNRWAHQEQFSTQDTLRALDTMARLLEMVNAPEQHEGVRQAHDQVMRTLYAEQSRQESRRRTQNLNTQGLAALVPWREIAAPHEDVRTGNFRQAEFAADLFQVHLGLAGLEYQDARAFFQRTFITEGIADLLVSAFNRLHGTGGDPVLELQTAFGGGKTHSMIALYHAASGLDPKTLAGFDTIASRLPVTDPLYVQRAVLVGTKLSPNEPRDKGNGIVVNTLWGELAYQLGGEAGYRLVANSDRSGHAPGAQVLQKVFEIAGPSLILIDEWVAFMRPLYYSGDIPPAAGSFDANLTFAQNLTEAVVATPQVLLAASLPSSEMEVGGQGGQEALRTLQHTFSRVKASWRAASSNEGFEIVRRRLFQDVTDQRKRDGTIRMFMDMYRQNRPQFPTSVQEAGYQKRMEAAYPFHPETFDLLFETWGSLERFQRTRGVLRLMANVIHILWERNDTSPLIMPANIPLDASGVVTEINTYLPESWTAVLEHDIDGENAVSLSVDRENANFDKVSAARRVARTVFMGSAPTFRGDNRGIDDKTIRLGVVQPGESPAIFGDALRTLTDRATYLYSERGRYWFSTQASVTQRAQELLEQLPPEDIDHAIVDLLRSHQSQRGAFDRVHVASNGSGDIVDTPEATLILLGPAYPHIRGQVDPSSESAAPAVVAARNILDTRGEGRRQYRNALVFLAADRGKLVDLRKAVAEHIVWSDIVSSADNLNLDVQQRRQAGARKDDAQRTVKLRLQDTWSWLLTPWSDPEPGASVQWEAHQLRVVHDDESLLVAAGKRVENEGLVVEKLAGTMLRKEIEGIPSFRDGWTHIRVRDLADWFASYLYLQRLKGPSVLEASIRDGLRHLTWENETFAYADSWDEEVGRYRGLTTGIQHEVMVNRHGDAVLVHPVVARKQFDEDAKSKAPEPGYESGGKEKGAGGEVEQPSPGGEVPGGDGPGVIVANRDPKRYFGSVTLNPQTLASQVSEISREVVAQLNGIYGSKVKISLEIQAEVPDGIPRDKRRIVESRAEELRFDQSGFAED
jgi:hypothetical protein